MVRSFTVFFVILVVVCCAALLAVVIALIRISISKQRQKESDNIIHEDFFAPEIVFF